MKDGNSLDNRWVVPHNVDLLKRYRLISNVEWCNKTNLVKYLFKYITKGPDRRLEASSENQDGEGVDEVAEYISCRYLSPVKKILIACKLQEEDTIAPGP